MGSHHHRRDTIERVGCVVVTASDTRTEADDRSGPVIRRILEAAGHAIVDAVIVPDDAAAIRNAVMTASARPEVGAVFVTGGTGVAARDVTIESLTGTWSKELPGFGEIFRALSFEDIGTSSLQSRAFAGLANGTFLFCLPGSTSACRLGWEKLIRAQLDARTRPCNLAALRPRLRER